MVWQNSVVEGVGTTTDGIEFGGVGVDIIMVRRRDLPQGKSWGTRAVQRVAIYMLCCDRLQTGRIAWMAHTVGFVGACNVEVGGLGVGEDGDY